MDISSHSVRTARSRRLWMTIAVLTGLGGLVALAAGAGLVGGGKGVADETATEWLAIKAPVISFETASGSKASLADYRGRLVLLNFWGSWCAPCLREIPELIRVQRELEKIGGTIIGPAVDSGSGDDVLRFAARHGMTYPLWLATYDQAVGTYGAAGYPFTLLIDADGIVRKRYLGPQTYDVLMRDIRALQSDPPVS